MGATKVKDANKRRGLFLRQFIERPTEVASVVPSSSKLVQALIAQVPYQDVRLAIEYGPGTGAITEKLRSLLPDTATYVAAEPNEAFRAHLIEEGLKIELIPNYAQNIAEEVLGRYGEADIIVSGLPCSVIPLETLQEIFQSTHRLLRSGGEFRMFIYTHTLIMPKMHRMISMLEQTFTNVETTVVWLNLPPATVIRCIK